MQIVIKMDPLLKKSNSLLANPMAKEFVILNASGFESRLEDIHIHRCQHEEELQDRLDPETYSNKHYDTKF